MTERLHKSNYSLKFSALHNHNVNNVYVSINDDFFG